MISTRHGRTSPRAAAGSAAAARPAAAALLFAFTLGAPSAIRAETAPGASDATLEAPREADRLVRTMEERLAKSGSLSASFTQTFRSAGTNQQVVERGRLFVKRPGRMRWDYRQPDKKVVLVNADGSTLSYVPAEYAAVRSRIPSDAPHMHLLLGDSRLLDSFVAAEVRLKQPAYPGSKQIKLTPRKATDGVEVVYLELEPRTLGVQRVLIVDPLGNESDLVLDKMAEDARLQDDAFELQLPPGVALHDATAAAGR